MIQQESRLKVTDNSGAERFFAFACWGEPGDVTRR